MSDENYGFDGGEEMGLTLPTDQLKKDVKSASDSFDFLVSQAKKMEDQLQRIKAKAVSEDEKLKDLVQRMRLSSNDDMRKFYEDQFKVIANARRVNEQLAKKEVEQLQKMYDTLYFSGVAFTDKEISTWQTHRVKLVDEHHKRLKALEAYEKSVAHQNKAAAQRSKDVTKIFEALEKERAAQEDRAWSSHEKAAAARLKEIKKQHGEQLATELALRNAELDSIKASETKVQAAEKAAETWRQQQHSKALSQRKAMDAAWEQVEAAKSSQMEGLWAAHEKLEATKAKELRRQRGEQLATELALRNSELDAIKAAETKTQAAEKAAETWRQQQHSKALSQRKAMDAAWAQVEADKSKHIDALWASHEKESKKQRGAQLAAELAAYNSDLDARAKAVKSSGATTRLTDALVAKDREFNNRVNNALTAFNEGRGSKLQTLINHMDKVRAVVEQGGEAELRATKKYGKEIVEAIKRNEDQRYQAMLTGAARAKKLAESNKALPTVESSAKIAREMAFNPEGPWSAYTPRTLSPIARGLQVSAPAAINPAARSVHLPTPGPIGLTPVAAAAAAATATVSGLKEVPKFSELASMGFKKLSGRMLDAHSAARGLASGFNLLWLTWGQLAPLFVGAAFSMGTKAIVTLGAEVDHTLTTIKVLSGESSEAVEGLRTQLYDLGANGIFGPLEIAKAMKTLSLAGLSAGEVASSLRDVLNFAIAGDTTIEKSADVLTSVAKAFEYSADSYNIVSDVIAKASAISKSSVENMSEAFKSSTVVHAQYGVSLQDVATGLAVLSNVGVTGSAAGTALRNFYADAIGRTPKMAAAMEKLKLSLYDAKGELKDFATFMLEANEATKKLTLKDFTKLTSVLSTERGGKVWSSALQEVRKGGQGVVNELRRLSDETAKNSAGFSAQAAAELVNTPLNQMKSVVATLQVELAKAFQGMEGTVVTSSARMKEIFQSNEFHNAVSNLITLVANLTKAILDNLTTVGLLAGAYLGLKSAGLIFFLLEKGARGLALSTLAAEAAMLSLRRTSATAAVTATTTAAATATTTAATVASTGATMAAVGAATKWGSKLLSFARILPGVGTAIALAGLAWEGYAFFQDEAAKSSNDYADKVKEKNIIDKLKEETKALNDKTEALKANISVEELYKRREIDSQRRALQAPVELAKAELDAAKSRLAAFTANQNSPLKPKAGLGVLAPGFGAASLQQAQSDVALAELAYNKAVSNAAAPLRALQQESAELAETKRLHTEAAKAYADAEKDSRRNKRGGGTLALEDVVGDLNNLTGKGSKLRLTEQLNEIQQLAEASLSATQKKADDELKLVKAKHEALLMSDMEYQIEVGRRTLESEEARINTLKSTNIELIVEADRHRKALLATYSGADLQEKLREHNLKVEAMVKSNNSKIEQIESDANMRRLLAAMEFEKELGGLQKGTTEFFAKLAQDVENNKVDAELERKFSRVNEYSSFAERAEKASAMAAQAVLNKVEVQLTKERELLRNLTADYAKLESLRGDSAGLEALASTLGIDTKGLDLEALYRKVVESYGNRMDKVNSGITAALKKGHIEAAKAGGEAYKIELEKAIEQVANQLTDVLVTALTKGGSAAREKLKEGLFSDVEKKLLKPLEDALFEGFKAGGESLLGIFGSLLGLKTGGSTDGGISSSGGVTSLGDVVKGLNTVSDVFSSKFTESLTKNFTKFAESEIGAKLGLSKAGGGLSSTGTTISNGISMAGNALTGYGAYSVLNGGYSFGNGLDTVAQIASLFGPVYGAISGLVTRAFGKKLSSTGIQGMVGADGFKGGTFEFYKGGTFRSDSTKYNPLDAKTQSEFDLVVQGINVKLAMLGSAFGAGADSLEGFSKSIAVMTKGKSAEQIQSELNEQFQAYGDAAAQRMLISAGKDMFSAEQYADIQTKFARINELEVLLLDRSAKKKHSLARMAEKDQLQADIDTLVNTVLKDFVRAGEAYSDTLQRLGENLTYLNAAFDVLGWTALDASLTGAGIATKFAESFAGGLSEATSKLGSYYEHFYSDSQKSSIRLNDLTEGFKELNKELPSSREVFVQMVEAAKAASNYELLTGLLNLENQLDQLFSVDRSNALSNLIDAYNSQIEVLNESLTTLEPVISSFKALKDSLTYSDKSILKPVDQYAAAEKAYRETYTKALSGDTTAAEEFRTVSEKFLELSRTMYGSGSPYSTDYERVQSALGMLTGIYGPKYDETKSQKESLEKQVKYLENLDKNTADIATLMSQFLTYFTPTTNDSQKAIEALVTDSYGMLGRTGFGMGANQIDPTGYQYWYSKLAGGMSQTDFRKEFFGGAGKNSNDVMTSQVLSMYAKYGVQNPDTDGVKYWTGRLSEGMTTSEFEKAFKVAGQFATGGYTAGGMNLVGEHGRELQVTGPARYYSASQTRDLLGNIGSNSSDETEENTAVLKEVLAELKALKVAVLQGAAINSQSTELNTVALTKAIESTSAKAAYTLKLKEKSR